MSDRPCHKYTVDVSNSNVSSSGYSVYYIPDYNDMEYVIRYTFTQGKVTEDKTSREKETKRNKEERNNE